ncbi:MAG: hypothetical protein LBP96_02390, partial [Bacteroidales bacterium]|nr:hypothetical protein [Bacteroidales bacterium]
MSEHPNTQPQTEQIEIDLLEVTVNIFSALGRGIRALLGWIKDYIQWFFRFTKKYFWILAALTVIGAIGGYTKAKMQKPFYETEMLVETQLVARAQIADRINNLQKLIA